MLYFYPKNNTPGCNIESQTFKAAAASFNAKEAMLVGISADSVDSHKSYKSDNNLPQTLLSDPNKEVRQLYQVDGDLFGILDGRQTFVIDENGIIKLVYNNQFGPDKHAEMALDVL